MLRNLAGVAGLESMAWHGTDTAHQIWKRAGNSSHPDNFVVLQAMSWPAQVQWQQIRSKVSQPLQVMQIGMNGGQAGPRITILNIPANLMG